MTAPQFCACGNELCTNAEATAKRYSTCQFLHESDLHDLRTMLIAAMKELGEIAECLIKRDRPNHWKNELGDLCGLAIAPMLELAGMDFETACEIGRARKKEKMEGNAKKSVNELLEKMGVEYRELKFEDGVVGWVILTETELPDWINTVFTIGEVIS